MSESNWSRFATPALVAVVIVSYAAMFYNMGASRSAYETEAQARAEQHHATAGSLVGHHCAGLQADALSECLVKEIKATRDDQRTEYDLSAQRNMADAAWWMVAISSLTMLITGAALWYVKGTLDETRLMVGEAKDATNEMIRANEIARDAQRAWIKIIPNILRFKGESDGGFEIEVRVDFENVGKSIASNVKCIIRLFIPKANIVEEIEKEFVRTQRKIAARRDKVSTALVPGDKVWYGTESRHAPSVKRAGRTSEEAFSLIIVALVRYEAVGFSSPRVAMRAFSVGQRGKLFEERAIKKAGIEKISIDDLVLHPIGGSAST